MRRMKFLVIGVALISASLTVWSSSALASTSPDFTIEGAPFLGGGGESVFAEETGAQVLKASSIEIECPYVAVGLGAEINATEPGTGSESLAFSGCHQKGNSACEARTKGGMIAEQIFTNLLKTELVFATKTGSEKAEGPIDVLFTRTGNIVEIEFKGINCPLLSNGKVTGSIAFEDGPRAVEETWTAPAAPITQVFRASGVKVNVQLNAFGFFGVEFSGVQKVGLLGVNAGKQLGFQP